MANTTNIQSITQFDRLPTESLFHIFGYLSNNDILYTFFYFNKRFHNLLLQNQRYLTCLEVPTTDCNTWEKILSIVGSRIECLSINAIYLSFPLRYFPNLKSIILSSPHALSDKELKSLVESEQQFQNIKSFKVKVNELVCDRSYNNNFFGNDYLFERIFNYENC